MRVHILQHFSFDEGGAVLEWAKSRGHTVSVTRVFDGEALPDPARFDFLFIAGGEPHPPLIEPAKNLIRMAVARGKYVLGICYGSQILAEALGGAVTQNPEREAGWLEVRLTPDATRMAPFRGFPASFTTLCWHGDTFSGLPRGAFRAAESDGCPNHAFCYGDRVVGLQFHLEIDGRTVENFLEHLGGYLDHSGAYVQDAGAIQEGKKHVEEGRRLTFMLLDNMTED